MSSHPRDPLPLSLPAQTQPGALIVASYDHPGKHRPRRLKYRHSEVWLMGGGARQQAQAEAGVAAS